MASPGGSTSGAHLETPGIAPPRAGRKRRGGGVLRLRLPEAVK